ncbi:BLOC-1-related complex subunit 6 [Anopheles arabiensis]|uniref:BLOC-1-related complex subunit 6 C-terminal helix domain-containing protein n=1 Tax=Anopheles arabiensis TaxID=7173 RepID=A0A182ICP3_ANOAR|nr:BLOC-1-related complex subunit 6 [Anopheles arabiensis]
MSESDHRRKNPFAAPARQSDMRQDAGDDFEGHEQYDETLGEEVPSAMTESYSEIAYTHNLFAGAAAEETDGSASNGNQPDGSSSSSSSSQTKKRPDSLVCDGRKASFPYNLEGTVRVDGNMTHFVAENLEYKIKLASPVTVTRKDSCNLSSSRQSTPSAATGGLSGLSFGPGTSGANLTLPGTSSSRGPMAYGSGFVAPHPASASSVDPNVLNEIEREAQALAASVDNLSESLCSVLHSISSITADNVEIYKNSVTKLTDCMDGNIKCMYTIMAKAEEISKTIKPAEALAVRIREIKRLVDMLESNV